SFDCCVRITPVSLEENSRCRFTGATCRLRGVWSSRRATNYTSSHAERFHRYVFGQRRGRRVPLTVSFPPDRLSLSYFFSVSRLASQSRDWASPFRSNSIFPLMLSPLILPLYFWVNLFPLNS